MEENAKKSGATVLKEPKKGYGYACLKGMDYIANLEASQLPNIIVFLDGDYSDYPEQLTQLVAPILNDKIDFVLYLQAFLKFNEFNLFLIGLLPSAVGKAEYPKGLPVLNETVESDSPCTNNTGVVLFEVIKLVL